MSFTIARVEQVYDVTAVPGAESYAIFRCAQCECVNFAWEGSEKYNRITERGILNLSLALCRNASCPCHGSGGRVQAKRIHVGKDAPWD